MSTPGATELLIVLVIVLVILGPKRLPSLGRQLGGGIREFRRSLGGGDSASAREPVSGREPVSAHEVDADRPAPGSPAAPAAAEPDADRRSV